MRRLLPLLAPVALMGACGVDGPPHDVRVVVDRDPGELAAGEAAGRPRPADDTVDASPEPDPDRADDERVDDERVDDPATPSREDRPGSLGALRMPTTVAVVGDSLTVAATDEITAALTRAGVRAVIVDGRESRRMATGADGLPSGVAAIEDILVRADPDLWVVALGTNDVAAEVAAERFLTDLRETLAALPTGAPVVWVDVWIRDRVDDVVDANALVRDELDRRVAPTVVVDWFSTATADGLITGDGVHLTQAGQNRFASSIVDAVVELGVSTR